MNSIPGPILRAIESLHLPAMPQILLRFLEEAGSESASVDTLAQLVMRDPALSARMLTVANSAAFRRNGEMRGIKQSLMALGTRMVRTIASCLVVQSVFARMSDARPQDLAGFWRHSLFVAELARATAAELQVGEVECEEAYLAGLLHDVGQLVLLGGLGKAYGTLLSRSQSETDLVGNERPVLATDHAAVGAWVVDQWELPSLMADAILFHHWDLNQVATADRLTRILWAAHFATVALEPAWSVPAEIDGVSALIGIETARFRVLRDEAARRVDAMATALGVAEAPAEQTLPQWTGGEGANGADEEPAAEDAESRLLATASAMAAMQPLQQNFIGDGDGDDADMLVAVRESARILFGVQRLALLLALPGQATLSGAGIGGQPAALQRLEIVLKSGASLCADAALSCQPRSTFDTENAGSPAPADVQIARALGGASGSDGLLYIPICGPQGVVGVMVCGVSTVQHARLRKRLAWLQSFATLVGASVVSSRRTRERRQQIEADAAGRFRLQGQKVAHEAANPLGIIRNYLTIVDLKLPDSKALGQDIAVLREEIERVSTIIRQLGEDAAPVAAPSGALDLNALVEGMRALYGESLFGSRGITLDVQPSPEPALARAERDGVKQILFNLWKNAAEAVAPGSEVQTSVTPGVDQNGRRYIELCVSDNGPGLPADVLKSLYQPLDPARQPGRSGLGLSIVRSLVDRLEGHISCRSRAGHGTSFAVLLPESERVDG
ncbi:HDOD domain-containing protein [Ideonella sp.]|uniref:HDOD domain-containing protein n=1 Tax=Ideonella sp. TaxID=1929293 RepID=UPI002B49ABAD|nr:HDOD domain-containing protein [Ideonella sp.]HJV72473.1 HDOD domain-containing protein [Ideonella sp.]